MIVQYGMILVGQSRRGENLFWFVFLAVPVSLMKELFAKKIVVRTLRRIIVHATCYLMKAWVLEV
jgi:hypothetical protein